MTWLEKSGSHINVGKRLQVIWWGWQWPWLGWGHWPKIRTDMPTMFRDLYIGPLGFRLWVEPLALVKEPK